MLIFKDILARLKIYKDTKDILSPTKIAMKLAICPTFNRK